MKNFWEKHKIWLTVVGYLALMGVFFYFGVFSLIGKIKANSDEAKKRLVDNEIKQAKLAKIPEMEESHNAYKEKDPKAGLASEKEIDFIKKLESLAEETGNKISLKIEEKDNKKEISKQVKKDGDEEDIKNNLPSDNYLVMQIGLEGNYAGLVNFVRKLENADNYVTIVSIDSKKGKAESDSRSQFSGSSIFGVGGASKTEKNKKSGEEKVISSFIEAVVYIEK